MFYIIKKRFININKNQALFLDTDFPAPAECISIIFSGVDPQSFYCMSNSSVSLAFFIR